MSLLHLWTADDAAAQLAATGIVWNIGQLSSAAIRHLNRLGLRQRAMWPWFHVGTIEKTCWLAKTSHSQPKED